MPIELDERGRALENEYFHRKEKELLEKMKAKIEGEEGKDLQLQCPKCDGTLYETDYENITIDVCNKCGRLARRGRTRADGRKGRRHRRLVWEDLWVRR